MSQKRELDALVAEKLMGHTVEWIGGDPFLTGLVMYSEERGGRFSTRAPHYSTDITAAWEVVEKMRNHPSPRFQNLQLVAYCYNRTYATFDTEAFNDYDAATWTEANGENSTALAICLAALKASAPPIPKGEQP